MNIQDTIQNKAHIVLEAAQQIQHRVVDNPKTSLACTFFACLFGNLTTEDWIQYASLTFLIFQIIIITPKVFKVVSGWVSSVVDLIRRKPRL